MYLYCEKHKGEGNFGIAAYSNDEKILFSSEDSFHCLLMLKQTDLVSIKIPPLLNITP